MMSEKIRLVLAKKNKSKAWLAEQLGWSTSNLYNKFKRDNFSEKELIEIFTKSAKANPSWKFSKYFRTFRGMKKIFRSENEIKGFYSVDLQVKRRYINPLVKTKTAQKEFQK